MIYQKRETYFTASVNTNNTQLYKTNCSLEADLNTEASWAIKLSRKMVMAIFKLLIKLIERQEKILLRLYTLHYLMAINLIL